MNFRKTTEKDLESVITIIDEAKEFLKNNNIDQWQNGYPNKEVILKDIENDNSYVLEDNGEIIATTVVSFDLNSRSYRELRCMRIDTHKDNKTMQRLILKNGYEYCGIIFVEDGTERLAFEKELQ